MANNYGRHIKEVALQLLGEPGETNRDEWRYGSHGSLAIQTDAGSWYSHEEETGGGVLDLIQRETGAGTLREAIQWLEAQGYEQPDGGAPAQPRQAPRSAPAPAAPAKPKTRAKIVETYDYCDENGELRYQVVRMEPKTFRQRRPDGDGWDWKIKGTEPLPYRLPDMLAKPSATVLIVEGEKDADRLAGMGFVATCNSGGAGKWQPALNGHFERRNVVIIPDNDEAGQKHTDVVGEALHSTAETVRVAHLPGLPDKGDVSDWLDAGGTRDALIAACKAAEAWQPKIIAEPTPEQPEDAPATAPVGKPFRPLGYDGASYYYLPRGTEQVTTIPRGSHTGAAQMLGLAPIEWWEMQYPKGDAGIDWQLAASDCMRRCERMGVYDAGNIRGRGAWYDNGQSVLHLGNRLIVGGEVKQIVEHESQYIYTKQAQMESIINAKPATVAEAKQAFDLFQKLNWSKPMHGWVAAGFAMLAPICGALRWRPHMWLTSQRGAGKSWVQDNLFRPMMGQSSLIVQGGTTEAGIRQHLQQDARPIMFDEAEVEDTAGQRRMKGVIELARQSSSDSSAEVVKGTADGSGMAFRIRSMFLMGSINVPLDQAADESRFTVVSLEKPSRTPASIERFQEFRREVEAQMTDDYCASLRARAYEMIPIIRQNAETMAQAVAEVVGSQRIGDQVGTLLAGAVAYSMDRAITINEARSWAAQVDLTDAQESEQVSDEMMCLQAILQSQVVIEGAQSRSTRALAELVQGASGRGSVYDASAADCNAALGRHGLGVEGDWLMVSNTHTQLKRILRETPWAAGWSRLLKRMDGAETMKSPQRFAGVQTRAVRIPMWSVI